VFSGVKRNVFRRDAENRVTIAFDSDIDLNESLLNLFRESGRRRQLRRLGCGWAIAWRSKHSRQHDHNSGEEPLRPFHG
jgi:hypothetical protein